MKKLTLSLMIFSSAVPTFAANLKDSANFRARFQQELEIMKPQADANRINELLYGADKSVEKALDANSVEEMLQAMRGDTLTNLSSASKTIQAAQVKNADLKGRKLTLIVVPGVFAEFIKNRAFEDILEKPSQSREQFKALVAEEKAKGNPAAVDSVVYLKNFVPDQDPSTYATATDLSELLHIGEMDVHGASVRVVLLGTPFSSLESLGGNEDRAKTFNRRLGKYLELTEKDQTLAFVGYSRGTPLGLEMLSQAQAAHLPWVSQVKGMVSYSGVVLGSALADDVVENEESVTRKLLLGLRMTAGRLQKYTDQDNLLARMKIYQRNASLWAQFAKDAAPMALSMNKGKGSLKETIQQLAQVDPRAPVGIALQMAKELGLNSPLGDYNNNIDRFRNFVEQLLTSVKELSTSSRTEWFRTHNLPSNVTYYGLAAAMANPDANAFEKNLFANPLAYGNGSYDDAMLVQNRKDYETISKGLALNDSQVSVIQSTFPKDVLTSLNPRLANLQTKFLGITGTHHWGMALREVNKMRGGQVNGFPREALLRAISVQIMNDSESK